jgi:hypothetical protein
MKHIFRQVLSIEVHIYFNFLCEGKVSVEGSSSHVSMRISKKQELVLLSLLGKLYRD